MRTFFESRAGFIGRIVYYCQISYTNGPGLMSMELAEWEWRRRAADAYGRTLGERS